MARGVTIREQALSAAPIEALNISTIGIVGTAPDASGDFLDSDGSIKYNEPILLTRRSDAVDLGDSGTLPLHLDAIYAQGGGTVVIVIVEKTEDLTSQISLNAVADEFKADIGDLAADGDYTIGTVAGQLSISFYSLTGSDLDNVRASGIGREFTAGTNGPTYEVAGEYISASKRIPVTLTSGSTPTSDASADLALEAQVAVDGESEDRTTATGDLENRTGIYALLDAESAIGRRPRLIAAPGLDTGSRPNSAKNPLAAALEIVATKLRGIAYLDGPNTTHNEIVTYAGDFNTARAYIIDPGGLVADPDDGDSLIDVSMSAFALGVTARVDSREGWWNSPSNRPILGLQKLKRPIDYSPGDANSRAVILNIDNSVATVIRYQGGFRLFGNRTPASTDPAFKFLSVRRIADNIEDSVQDAMFYYIDKNINKNFLRLVTERANGFLRNMIAQGALVGAECFPDAELNTKENLALGKVHFNVKFTPPYPAEEIIFTFNLVNDYLTTISV